MVAVLTRAPVAVSRPDLPDATSRAGEYLDDEAFWALLRDRMLPLRPSQYDITALCNLTCEGCLFFSGEEHLSRREVKDIGRVEAMFAGEARRGIRFGYFGGAEPSLVESKLLAAARHIPYGTVFSNGTKRLSDEIPYRVHVSVWGRPEQDRALRGASMLAKQTRNYRGDRRAVFSYTVNSRNIGDIAWVSDYCADNDLRLTFNHYSPTLKYRSFLDGDETADRYHSRSTDGDGLILKPDDLRRTFDIIGGLMADGGEHILYSSAYSARIHDPAGLYPDLDTETGIALSCGSQLNQSFKHFNFDLTAGDQKCCTPNISCSSCRLYAQSFATLLMRSATDLRRSRGKERSIPLWRLWCALFLNDDTLSSWKPLG